MIRLHHIPASRSFRTLWLLTEMALECQIIPYSITDGSLRAPEYLAKSLAGRVPALDIDGITLFESGAILEYLCETRPENGLGRFAGDPERGKFLEWLHFSETQAHLIANLNLQHLFLKDASLASPTVLKTETARLTGTLKAMERALGEQDWLLASGFSAVDTMMGYNLFASRYYVRMENFPTLQAYCNRITQRPAYQAARARDGQQKFFRKDFYEVPNG